MAITCCEHSSQHHLAAASAASGAEAELADEEGLGGGDGEEAEGDLAGGGLAVGDEISASAPILLPGIPAGSRVVSIAHTLCLGYDIFLVCPDNLGELPAVSLLRGAAVCWGCRMSGMCISVLFLLLSMLT